MNEITLRHEFTGAGTSPPYRVAGPALLVQTDGVSVTLQGSNMPDDAASWQDLGVCTGYTPLEVTTSFAFVRVAAAGAGVVAVSGASAPAAGAGGGGGGGGAVTIADGADIALGARNQAAATDDTGAWSFLQLFKRLLTRMATGAKQDTTNARLSRMGGLAVAEVEELAGTTYVLYRSSIDSAMSYVVVRTVTTGGSTAVRYAGVTNNPTMTTSSAAWTARVTLTYGTLAEA